MDIDNGISIFFQEITLLSWEGSHYRKAVRSIGYGHAIINTLLVYRRKAEKLKLYYQKNKVRAKK